MDILVSIPDEVYDYDVVNALDAFLTDYFHGDRSKITILPKGHGKIIDESQITKVYFTQTINNIGGVIMPSVIEVNGTDAPAIVEQNRQTEGVMI